MHTPDRFEWVEGAIAAVKRANDAGALVIVVTNQAGIARGYYDAPQFEALMHWINARLAEHGAHLDGWYHCPHHPTAGDGELTRACDCRKPAPGLLLRAQIEWGFDPKAAVMIGDKPGDVEAAHQAGMHGRLFHPGNEDLNAAIDDALTIASSARDFDKRTQLQE